MLLSLIIAFFNSVAWAQDAAPAAGARPNMLETFMPFIFVFVIFYFLLIRPQQKQRQQHQNYVSALKRGDSVLTTGGILGTIEGLTDTFITLEIANGVRIRVLRSAIAGPAQGEAKS